MSGKRSKYCLVVGRKRRQDVELRLRVSANSAAKLKEMAEDNGEIRIPEMDFLWMLEGSPTIHGETMELNVGQVNEVQVQPENLLEEAARIIYGDREHAYGNPRFNLDTIAQLWSVYINRKFPENTNPFINDMKLTAYDVSQLMILLKTARLIHNPTHHDSLVDQAGYAALQKRIQGMPS
jgi:hypothetical protein